MTQEVYETSQAIYKAALIGFQVSLDQIDRQIAYVREQMRQNPTYPQLLKQVAQAAERKRAAFSPETRARMAEAQRKRWAKARRHG